MVISVTHMNTHTTAPNLDRYSDRQLEAIIRGGTLRDGTWTPLAEDAFTTMRFRADGEAEANEVCCSICDGLGHGQPGYGPCPLEMGADDGFERWEAQFAWNDPQAGYDVSAERF